MRKKEIAPLLKLAAPIALTQIANMAMQLVDTMFVGRLGAEAIGGVSVGNAVFVTVMIVGLGFIVGLDFLASRAIGAGRMKDCHDYLVQALFLATFYSLAFIGVMLVFSNGFNAIRMDSTVARLGGEYLRALCWSLWPFLLFTAFRQYLLAMGVVAPILVILVAANGVNALCNRLLIFGYGPIPALGVTGSGISTCIARAFMLTALVWYVLARDRRRGLGLREVSLRVSRARLRELVRLGLPSAGQMLLEVGVFAGSTLLAGRLGAVPLAAHHIVLQIASVVFMVPLGISSAAAVRVGHAVGAGRRKLAADIGWTAIASGAALMACAGIALYLAANPLMRAFTVDPFVVRLGSSLLLVTALFQLGDSTQVVATGVLRGAGNTRASFLANLAGHWFLGLPVGIALCFWLGWGVYGIWIGLSFGLFAVAVALLWAWRTLCLRLEADA